MEIWRRHPSHPAYAVSTRGRVCRAAPGKATYVGRMLKPYVEKSGYERVRLHEHGKRVRKLVHVLVLETFAGPRPSPQHEGRHGRGGKRDNRWPENLCWGTKSENGLDKLLDGTDSNGERSGKAKLTAAQVRAIRADDSGRTLRAIAAQYGVCHSHIYRIRQGQQWRYLPAEAVAQ